MKERCDDFSVGKPRGATLKGTFSQISQRGEGETRPLFFIDSSFDLVVSL